MIPKMIRPFVVEVLKATENERVKWVEGDGDAFFCDRKGVTLHLGRYFDDDRERESFYFRMKGEGRNVVFSVYDDEDPSDFRLLKDLYETAGVNAAHISEIVKNFFD